MGAVRSHPDADVHPCAVEQLVLYVHPALLVQPSPVLQLVPYVH